MPALPVPMSELLGMDMPNLLVLVRGLQISDQAPVDESSKVMVSAEDFKDESQWTISKASVKLGFPLKIKRLPHPENEDNESVHGFFLDVDPTKSTFGELLEQGPIGKVIVVRCNGEARSNAAATCLTAHIEANISLYKEGMAAAEGDTVKIQQITMSSKID